MYFLSDDLHAVMRETVGFLSGKSPIVLATKMHFELALTGNVAVTLRCGHGLALRDDFPRDAKFVLDDSIANRKIRLTQGNKHGTTTLQCGITPLGRPRVIKAYRQREVAGFCLGSLSIAAHVGSHKLRVADRKRGVQHLVTQLIADGVGLRPIMKPEQVECFRPQCFGVKVERFFGFTVEVD